MALNTLSLDVTTGLQGSEFRSKIVGLTAGSQVTLGNNTAVIGGGVLNGYLVHPNLPYSIDANVFEIIERVPLTGENKTTRVSVTGVSRRQARIDAVAALTGGRTERSTRFGGAINGNGSRVWSTYVEDDLGADHVTAVGSSVVGPSDVRDGLVLEWDVRDLTGTNGVGYAGNWADRQTGAIMNQTSAANRPILTSSVAAFGGLLGLTNEGGPKSLDMGRPAALMSALANHNNATGVTGVFVTKGRSTAFSSKFMTLWGPTAVLDPSSFVASYKFQGFRDGKRDLTATNCPFEAGLQIIIVRSINISGVNRTVPVMINGQIIPDAGGGSLAPHPSNNYSYGGAPGDDTYYALGDFGDQRWYNRCLSNAECANLTRYLWQKYGKTGAPWDGAPFYMIGDGDSYSSVTSYNWLLHLAQNKNHPYSALGNMAVPSRKSDQMRQTINLWFSGFAGALGIPVVAFAQEYYNDPDTDAGSFIQYLNELRIAAPEVTICAMDAWDNGKGVGVAQHDARASYNSALAAATSSWDFLIPVSASSEMGIEGACPNTGGTYTNTPFDDDVGHPSADGTNPGVVIVANIAGPIYDAAAA